MSTQPQFKKAYPGETVKKQLIGQNLAAVIRHVDNHFANPAKPSS